MIYFPVIKPVKGYKEGVKLIKENYLLLLSLVYIGSALYFMAS